MRWHFAKCIYPCILQHAFYIKLGYGKIGIEKLGFAGVYLIFLVLIRNVHCGHSGEAVLTCTHNICVERTLFKKFKPFPTEFSIFASVKNLCILLLQMFRNATD